MSLLWQPFLTDTLLPVPSGVASNEILVKHYLLDNPHIYTLYTLHMLSDTFLPLVCMMQCCIPIV